MLKDPREKINISPEEKERIDMIVLQGKIAQILDLKEKNEVSSDVFDLFSKTLGKFLKNYCNVDDKANIRFKTILSVRGNERAKIEANAVLQSILGLANEILSRAKREKYEEKFEKKVG